MHFTTKYDIIPNNKIRIGGIILDRITASFLSEFSTSNNFDMHEKSVQFEHFANYCVLSVEANETDINIENMYTGEAAQGIDGIAIEVNGSLVENINDLEILIKQNKILDVKFIFVQAKTSDSFDNAQISNFLTFVNVFFSEDARTTFSTDEMLKFIEIKDKIYDNSRYMRSKNPVIKMYYIAPGHWNPGDASMTSIIQGHKSNLSNTNLFSEIEFIPCGSAEIQKMYRASQEQMESTFVFSKNVMMFSDESGDYGYSGVLPFSEFEKIIFDNVGKLKSVFKDNIRDFLGISNYVNSDIEDTIMQESINAFCMLNNGITIVADSAVLVSDKMTIINYQIVNGCQTSHVLSMNREKALLSNILIPVKIIVTKNEELKNLITKATNNQTSIKKEQLEALSTFQKTLEQYYNTYSAEDERLYYERRTGQYRDSGIPRFRIVSIRAQIKNTSAMFNDRPHDAAGHYSMLLKDIGGRLFSVGDQQILYYTSSLALFRFECLVRNKKIDVKYKKGKYQIIMLFKYLSTNKLPKFHNAKKMITACTEILTALNDETICLRYFKLITEFISAQSDLQLDDRKLFEQKRTTDILLERKTQLLSMK